MFSNITIEWDAHFHSDGTRRKNGPPPSKMHGWLAKMRGTISGNEQLRTKGMREMAHANARNKALRERKRKQQGSVLSRWFGNPSRPARKSSHRSGGGGTSRRQSGASAHRHHSQRRIEAAPPQRRPSQAATPQRRPSQANSPPQRRASQPTPVRQASASRPRATPRRSNTTPVGHTPAARSGSRPAHRPGQGSRRPTR
ncbi:hypothetical protein BD626DRAFT_581045 [Schizophyllum amplum]|uniref:Uncharacterized protein n=1 Tax=Schizophyllum amplum TaxID=97359 RepID=A0A550CTK9_9AGAR|nr:hypothetical protein BD626DRAFT_581045 [Auriculariopsis ampla]